MKNIWLRKAEELIISLNVEFKKTGTISSEQVEEGTRKYNLLMEASERCN